MSYLSGVPQEIAAILPQDPVDQLNLAQQIIHSAYTSKIAQTEQECAHLRQSLAAKSTTLKTLERKVTNLELEVSEANEKARQSLEEQTKLVGEKNALLQTIKKLNKDNAKLENFKRSLLQHLHDEDEDFDMPTSVLEQQNISSAPYGIPPTPTTAAINSIRRDTPGEKSAVSPSAFASPLGTSSVADITASNASPRIDGKEFFRQARARLSYEQFSSFLQNIKELNAHRQSREETLAKAKTIFGGENDDLYTAFEGLLSRHLPL